MNPVVGIVEGNRKIRDLIQRYLNMQDGLSCPIAAGSVEEILEHVKEHPKPDVILMDIQPPGMSGSKGIGILREKYPDTEIIVLTVYHDLNKIFTSLCAGASGYLLKHTSLSEIKEFIVKLARDGAPMSPQIARRVMKHVQENGPKHHTGSDLTPREYDIIKELASGLTYRTIADRLGISIAMIRTHMQSVYKKLHMKRKRDDFWERP